MTGFLIRLICFVAVLLGGTSISFASDCISDPNECTPKGLCEVATEMSAGNKLWSSAATSNKHVSFAQELGMNCGVVELKDPCDTDPNECKIKQLCEKATITEDGTKSWNSEAEAYVVVAKEYGLSCDVVEELKAETNKCKEGDTKSVKCRPIPIVPSDEETQTSGDCSRKNPQFCSTKQICLTAMKNGLWSDNRYADYAKKHDIDCRVILAEFLQKCSASNLDSCNNNSLCERATFTDASGNVFWELSFSRTFMTEARKRGLSCDVDIILRDFRQAFISQSQLKRKQLQYALKELRFYTYGVDGLWGKGTKSGFERFVDWANLEGRSESAVFRDLLSRVDVPSSFAAPTTTVTNSSLNSSSTKYYKGMKPIVSSPNKPAQQAWAICDPQARMASNEAQSSRQGSVSRGLKCKTEPDLLGGSRTRCRETSSSGGWPGLIPLLLEIDPASQAKRAGERVYSATMDYCLAKYGWKR